LTPQTVEGKPKSFRRDILERYLKACHVFSGT
jgi:hypothetical protein